jgi:PAS domain S-box-containing protein
MQTDDRYRRAAAAGGVGIWDWNLATGEIYVDPVLKGLLGYQDHEIRNHLDDWGRLVHADDTAAVFERAQAHIAGETPLYEVEHRMLHRDGSIRWFLVRGSVTRNAQGTAIHMAGTDTDITARKRSEEALRQAEELNRRIAESTHDCVKILAIDGRLIYMNRVGLQMLEITDARELLNRSFADFFEGEVRQAAEEALAQAQRGGRGRFQYLMRTASGVAKWWDAVVTPVSDVKGTIVQLLAVSRDITERRREEAIRATHHQVLGLIATGSALTDVLDCLVRLVEQQSGGMRCSVLLLDDDGTHVRHGAAPSLPDEYVRAIDGSAIGPRSGSCGTAMFLGTRTIVTDILTDPLWEDYRDVARSYGLRACWSTPIFSPQRQVLGSFAMYYDEPRTPSDAELQLIESAADVARIAIQQQRGHQALRHSEARNRAMVRAIPDWMFLTTVDGVFLDYQGRDASRLHTPPSAFLGKNITEVLPHPVAEKLAQAFVRVGASDESETVEYTLGSNDSERFYETCIVRCDGDKILSIVRDITDRKCAEMEVSAQRGELAHLSRVSMLGELTGALAHELSQPLTAVLSNAQAARNFSQRDRIDVVELRAALDDVIRNSKRAGTVIDRLRALLRKEATTLQPIDMNEVVREVVELARGEVVARRITVASTLAPDIPPVLGDRVQLQQVVLNLVLNACDAMVDTPAAQRHLELTTSMEGSFVQLAVSDHGVGIPKDQFEQVFEPFVTFRDQGLGLGLAISRSIVGAHRGSIRAENNIDGGATFRCFLPVADAGPVQQASWPQGIHI